MFCAVFSARVLFYLFHFKKEIATQRFHFLRRTCEILLNRFEEMLRNKFYKPLAIAVLLLSCGREQGPLVRDNPLDAAGGNWNPPVVTAMADTSVNINDSLAVTATSIDNGTVVKYVWAKDGATYADTTTAGSLKVVYPDSGREVVRLVAIDDDGVISAPDSCVITVTLDAPVVTAMADSSANINDSISVTATATDNGTAVKYVWAKDGATYADTTTACSLKVAYPDSGRAVVRLVAIDDDGVLSAPDSCVITVTLDAPVVTAMADSSVNIKDSLAVTATATDNGTVVKYVWAKDGATYADTTTVGSLKVVYPDSGREIVRVVAIDDDGVISAPDSCAITVTLDAPVVTARSDTAVSFGATVSVSVSVIAVDINTDGSIVKYYWDIGLNGWDDSTDAGSYTVTTTTGGPVTVRWAARDDDALFSYDTFTVLFNRPPSSAAVTAPTSNESWISFDWLTGKGMFPVTLSAGDPDGSADTLTYSLYTGPSAGSLSLSHSGRLTTDTLENIDSSATVFYRLVARDLFGDSAVSTGTFIAPPSPPPPDAPVTDIDGNVYPAVIIGNQVWTTVNLRVTRYNDGTAMPLVTDGSEWSGLSTAGYCFYNNTTDAGEQEKWGALYNWYAVNTGKLAPATGGWRVPTDSDWKALSNYLGGGEIAGGKMKEAGTANWSSPNTGATNESGFTALPGGICEIGGGFFHQGIYGYWWSSTEYNAANAYNRLLGYNCADLIGYNLLNKSKGFAVRLVRDLN
jgi:uncharacterized protein (TIGR02145 family)